MLRILPRTAALYLSLVLLAAAATHAAAGELSRPVPPDARVTRFTRFNIRYTLRDVVADGVQKVEFYITEDMGRTWRLYGEDPDKMSPMTVQVPGEGVYGFVCIVTDRFGNREREPGPRSRPETVIVVDQTPPTAKWLAPTRDILGKGAPIEFKWETHDPYFSETPVMIQYAVNARSNHDREADWQPLQEKLPPSGTWTWTPPDAGSNSYNFRLIAEDRAGNMAVAYNAATVRIDTEPPTILSVEPLRSAKLSVDLYVQAEDTGSGVKEVSMYTSANHGSTWTLVKETSSTGESVAVKRAPGAAIPFTAPSSGTYAIWPVAFDNAGNGSPLPPVGATGPFILTIDNEPPSVTLSDSFLMGRSAVLANDSRTIIWSAYDPHLQDNSAVILLSLDNGDTWQELRSYLPCTGSETISFPFGAQSEDARIKVTVADQFGNVGEAVSQSFKISSADTVIESVTPVDSPSASPVTSGMPFLSGDPYGSLPTPIAPAPAPTTSLDPYSAPAPAAPAYDGPVGESTAGSLPQAMIGRGRPSAPPPAPAPAVSAPAAPIGGWAPSEPLQSSAGSVPAAPPWQASTPPPAPAPAVPAPQQTTDFAAGGDWLSSASTPSLPAADAGWSLPPMNTPAPAEVAPPAPPPAVSAPSAPSAPAPVADSGSDWLAGAGSGSDFSMPAFDDSLFGDFSSPLPSFDSPAGADSSLPAVPSLPATGDLMAGSPAASAPASPAPAAPVAQPVQPSLPPVPNVEDSFAPPPLADAATARPANPRQESEYHAAEARRYLDEGRMDLSLESGLKALNADGTNPKAYIALSQAYAQQEQPDFPRAANLAKEATNIARENWESWWNCADVFYRWAHSRNRAVQSQMQRGGQRPPADMVDERNQALNNAQIAIGNAAMLVGRGSSEADRKQVAITQGEIAYLRALTIPEPSRPSPDADQLTRSRYTTEQAQYRTAVLPVLQEALPYFQAALQLDGAPSYRETFHLGIINFRMGGLERESGNTAQAATFYQEAARYLEMATTARGVPAEGPREAYYMLAYSYDQLSEVPGASRSRNKELALRYWRQTAEFYPPATAYRTYAEQRMSALMDELGQ